MMPAVQIVNNNDSPGLPDDPIMNNDDRRPDDSNNDDRFHDANNDDRPNPINDGRLDDANADVLDIPGVAGRAIRIHMRQLHNLRLNPGALLREAARSSSLDFLFEYRAFHVFLVLTDSLYVVGSTLVLPLVGRLFVQISSLLLSRANAEALHWFLNLTMLRILWNVIIPMYNMGMIVGGGAYSYSRRPTPIRTFQEAREFGLFSCTWDFTNSFLTLVAAYGRWTAPEATLVSVPTDLATIVADNSTLIQRSAAATRLAGQTARAPAEVSWLSTLSTSGVGVFTWWFSQFHLIPRRLVLPG